MAIRFSLHHYQPERQLYVTVENMEAHQRGLLKVVVPYSPSQLHESLILCEHFMID